MSKIYEALQLAGRPARDGEPQIERETVERTDSPLPAAIEAARPSEVEEALALEAPPFALRLEHNMTALYNSIQGLVPATRGRAIEFIGPSKGTGTSTLIREFAKVVSVRLKKSVLLLDADQQGPTHVHQFNLIQEHGWDSVLEQHERIESVLKTVEGSRLTVSQLLVKAGSRPLLFESKQFKGMLNRLKETFDLILIDAPPASEFAEGLILASKVDGVVMVVAAEETRWQVVDDVSRRIAMMGGNLLGSVLNKQRFHIPSVIYNRI